MPSHSKPRFSPSLAFILFCVFLVILWVAGGASRADAAGQIVVRAAAAAILIIAVLFGPSFSHISPALRSARAIGCILGAAIILALLQLVPLPPEIWQGLPGRSLFKQAAIFSGQPQPWRPLSIVPGATVNAAASLIVPAATLILVAMMSNRERSWLPGLMLSLVVASTLIGLMQFSGATLRNPLVNNIAGQVSGMFANRNHFAILIACGCLLAPVWAFLDGRRPGWRGPAALGFILLFVLTILANGSRAGLLVGVIGLGLGMLMVQQAIRKTLSRYPSWVFPALLASLVGIVAIVVLLSIAADRAVSFQRVFGSDAGQDMRGRGLSTVLTMIWTYFPAGSGLGGFDPIFRIHEPFNLLKPTYFNRAHNDWLEIILDAGVPGLLLLLCSTTWWAVMSIRAWGAGWSAHQALPKLGSAIILLIMIASAFDYPARTPFVMAMLVIAGIWLAQARIVRMDPALPKTSQHL